MDMHVDTREQLAGINSLCHHVGSGLELQQSGLMASTFILVNITICYKTI